MKKQKIDFTPMTEADANNMLADVHRITEKITDVKVTNWIDTKTKKMLFGLEVTLTNKTKAFLSDNSRAVIFDNKPLADFCCMAFKKAISEVHIS